MALKDRSEFPKAKGNALYSPQQLAYERSIGLELSDEANNNFYKSDDTQNWTNEQFEAWLATKTWPEETKEKHRGLFEGQISFDGNGDFSYE